MLHRCHGPRCGEDVRRLAYPRLHRHAAVHHREHLAGPGDMVCRPEDLSVLGACGGEEHSGLHADEAGRLAAAAPDHGPLPQGHDHPRSPRPRAVCGWPAVQDGRGIPRACQIQASLSQDHARQRDAQELGKGAPDTYFGKVVDTFGASRIAWGSNFPNSVGTLSEILGAARKAFSFAKASDQDWIFGKTALTLYPALAK